MLDVALVDDVKEIIERLVCQGMTIVIATQKARAVRCVADQVILMDQGVWFEMASPLELFQNPMQVRKHQFLARIL